jgi:hypothetical protein
MAIVLTGDNVDLQLTTTLSEVIAAPASGTYKRLTFTVANLNAVGGADATVDVVRTIGGTDRYIAKNLTVAVGRPQVFRDVLLKTGASLKARASAGTTLDFTSDVVTRTVA